MPIVAIVGSREELRESDSVLDWRLYPKSDAAEDCRRT